jgi:hypothetical protein
MHVQGRLIARLAAPLALVATAVAVLAIVLGSGVMGDDDEGETAAGTRDIPAATDAETERERPNRRRRATYTIKANDTLSGIAAQNGTTVERLQELNPELDPQGLVAGQKIKLRE